jgi:hypothetical protein
MRGLVYLMTFEILNFAFVFFSRFQRIEGAQVAPLVCSRIFLPGIYPVLAGF